MHGIFREWDKWGTLRGREWKWVDKELSIEALLGISTNIVYCTILRLKEAAE